MTTGAFGSNAFRATTLTCILALALGCGRSFSFNKRERANVAHSTRSTRIAPPVAMTSEAEAHPVSKETQSPATKELLQQSIKPIGESLAAQIEGSPARFEFIALRNPRPLVCHTSAGHISVSSGLVENLAGPEELAAVLALEMAELVVERQTPASLPNDLPPAGPDDAAREIALAAKIGKQQQPMVHANVVALANDLLFRAGYRHVDVAAVQEKVEQWTCGDKLVDEATESVEIMGN